MSSLQRAYEATKGQAAKKRPFEIAGEATELPRLTLGNRVVFEQWMQKHRDQKFSLSLIRNRAGLSMAEIISQVRDEWKEEGKPTDFVGLRKVEVTQDELKKFEALEKRAADDSQIAEELKRTVQEVVGIRADNSVIDALNGELMERVVRRVGPYTEELLKPFDTEAMAYAVELAMRQEDKELPAGAEKEMLAPVDDQEIQAMCLWVLGLEAWQDRAIEQAKPKSLDEAIEQKLGEPKNSETQPAGNSTTPRRSRSSAPSTDVTPSGSGA